MTADATIIASGTGFFGIFRIIFSAASTITIPTASLIPLKALATQTILRNPSRNIEMR